jgi:hypothetical protein
MGVSVEELQLGDLFEQGEQRLHTMRLGTPLSWPGSSCRSLT